jgi:hypothetical protein
MLICGSFHALAQLSPLVLPDGDKLKANSDITSAQCFFESLAKPREFLAGSCADMDGP